MKSTLQNRILSGLVLALFWGCVLTGSAQEAISLGKYKLILDAALNAVDEKIPGSARHRIEFGLNLFLAHEVWIGNMPLDALLKAVDAFSEAGVDRVDINPGLYPWLVEKDDAVIAKYDAVVERIRGHGLKLALNPQYSEYKGTVDSFAQWEARAIELYSELAKRYEPDMFVLVHEPTTMAARLRQPISVSEWMGFISKLAKAVKTWSPSTRLGAGGLASEREYLEAFARMPEVDFITFDIYGIKDLETCNELIRFAKLRTKSVYIEETWRPPYVTDAGLTPDAASLKNVGNSELEDMDRKWVAVMTKYAQANRLEAIIPVWTWPLFAYVQGEGNLDDPEYNRVVIEAILAGKRTSYFMTLQQLILQNRLLRN